MGKLHKVYYRNKRHTNKYIKLQISMYNVRYQKMVSSGENTLEYMCREDWGTFNNFWLMNF